MRDTGLLKNSPGLRLGLFEPQGSVAAVDQLPARSPGGRDQSPDIAAAIPVAAVIAGSADIEARAPEAAVPASVVTITPGGGGGRRQRSHTQRSRSGRNKRKFA